MHSFIKFISHIRLIQIQIQSIIYFKSDRLNFYDAEQKKVIEAALDDKRPLIIAYGPKGDHYL